MSLTNITPVSDLLNNALGIMSDAENQLAAAIKAEKNIGASDGELLRKIHVARTELQTARLWASHAKTHATFAGLSR